MSNIKISDLSRTLKLSSEEMLVFLEKSGIKSKSFDDSLTSAEKNLLLKAIKNKSAAESSQNRLNLGASAPLNLGEKLVKRVPGKPKTRLTLNPKLADKPRTEKTENPIDLNQIKDNLAQKKFSQIMQAKEKTIALNKNQAQNLKSKAEVKSAGDDKEAGNEKATDVKKPLAKNIKANHKLDKKLLNKGDLEDGFSNENQSENENSLRASVEQKRRQQEEIRAKIREQTKERLRQAINRVKDVKQSSKDEFENVHQFEKPVAPVVYDVKLTPTISVSDLAKQMAIKQSAVVQVLMNLDIPVTANQSISQDIAIIVIEELGHNYTLVEEPKEQDLFIDDEQFDSKPRHPVITIMGHVDHGKTTLLDAIRKTKVADDEAGGITQHIGAYQIKTKNNQAITFLDTPGHEAFSQMRARGANVTDIVVLVVAADDSVMPRTIESIQHAKAAKVPIVVAINKIDKPDANPEKVIKDLSQYGVMPEKWGGDNLFVEVSAKNNQGIDQLLDSIMLQAEMLDLKAPFKGRTRGVVIESRMEKGKGAVVTALITKGTLKRSDVVLCGLHYGKIRLMTDDLGQPIKLATPSTPVEILGLSGVPQAGDDLIVLDKEKDAKDAAIKRQQNEREIRLEKQQSASLDSFLDRIGVDDDQSQDYFLLVKADVSGSVEAIVHELKKLSTEDVSINVVGSGVGGISETDVNLAIASGAAIVGFNVRADSKAKDLIEREGVNLKYYSIIYELIDDITAVVKGLAKDEFKDEIIGIAEVREVFRSPKMGDIAGCMVIEGSVKRMYSIRVLRDGVVVYEGELESLRRIKEDVQEVKKGTECGIGVKNYNGIKARDQIEVYQKVKVEK